MPDLSWNINEQHKKRLLSQAEQDPFLGRSALEKHLDNFQFIVYNQKPVGFYIPFRDNDGRYRIGSIYIEPGYRSKGLAGTAVSNYFRNKRGRAWIEPDNSASQNTFKSGGFYKTGRTQTSPNNHRVYEEWVNMNAIPTSINDSVFNWGA